MGFVLDTCILIEIENGNKKVIRKINDLKHGQADEFFITFFTYCEFYYGAINKSERNKQKVVERLKNYKLLNTSQITAITFCELLIESKNKGRQIPQFDLLIAALCLERGFTLLTLDKDFQEISKLKVKILERLLKFLMEEILLMKKKVA